MDSALQAIFTLFGVFGCIISLIIGFFLVTVMKEKWFGQSPKILKDQLESLESYNRGINESLSKTKEDLWDKKEKIVRLQKQIHQLSEDNYQLLQRLELK